MLHSLVADIHDSYHVFDRVLAVQHIHVAEPGDGQEQKDKQADIDLGTAEPVVDCTEVAKHSPNGGTDYSLAAVVELATEDSHAVVGWEDQNSVVVVVQVDSMEQGLVEDMCPENAVVDFEEEIEHIG